MTTLERYRLWTAEAQACAELGDAAGEEAADDMLDVLWVAMTAEERATAEREAAAAARAKE